MPSLSICVSIYNNVDNFIALHGALTSNPHYPRHKVEFILFNDGSPKPGIDDAAREFCRRNDIRYLVANQNRGVASSWNALCRAASADLIALLNDDVRCGSDDWTGLLLSCFKDNPKLGIAYWCQRIVDPATGAVVKLTADSARPLETKKPVLRHNFSGAFFAFRKSLWQDISQPDGSTGFWEEMISYGEEFDFSAEVQNRGYFIVQLPFVWDHLHSQTFAANPEKRQRPISSYLSADEFNNFFGIATSPLRKLGRSLLTGLGARPNPSPLVPVLEYSMAMLDKKWRGRTILGFDGPDYLRKMRADGFPTALALAVQRGTFTLPQNIGADFAETLIDRSEKSLA